LLPKGRGSALLFFGRGGARRVKESVPALSPANARVSRRESLWAVQKR